MLTEILSYLGKTRDLTKSAGVQYINGLGEAALHTPDILGNIGNFSGLLAIQTVSDVFSEEPTIKNYFNDYAFSSSTMQVVCAPYKGYSSEGQQYVERFFLPVVDIAVPNGNTVKSTLKVFTSLDDNDDLQLMHQIRQQTHFSNIIRLTMKLRNTVSAPWYPILKSFIRTAVQEQRSVYLVLPKFTIGSSEKSSTEYQYNVEVLNMGVDNPTKTDVLCYLDLLLEEKDQLC